MSFSIVIPVYNGAETIGPLVERLLDVFRADPPQIVLVNDGSPDHSHEVCRSLRDAHPRQVVYLRLARNFGEHNAVLAGLNHATGDHVVIMDDDFQNPPEEVVRLVEHARLRDVDVVYARYAKKRHHWSRNLGSAINDRAATLLIGKPRGLYLSSFKCLNRFAVDQVIQYTGPYPYIDGLILRSTNRVDAIEVRHDPRTVGRSNYTLGKLVRLWMNMFVNFSVLPLRVSAATGALFSALGLILGLFAVVEKLVRPETPLGWASILICVLTFAGVQLLMLGLVGEYLGRLFLASNGTPAFVIREVHASEKRRTSRSAAIAARRPGPEPAWTSAVPSSPIVRDLEPERPWSTVRSSHTAFQLPESAPTSF